MVFMTTAEQGSFSDAARRLGVSPAAISQSIARLEEELEVRLFNRTTRQLMLTEDGRRFYAQCRNPVNHLDTAIRQLKASRDEPAGQLKVSLPNAFGRRFVLPLMAEFVRHYPKVKIFFGLHDHFSDLIEDGYDIGIKIGIMPDSRMSAREIAQIPQYVVAAPSYWRKHKKPEHPDDLSEHNCINFQFPTSGRMYKWEFRVNGERVPIEVNGTITANEIEGVVALACSGVGVAQIAGHEALPYIQSGQLEPVLLDYVSVDRSIYLCFPHSEHIPPRARVFVDFIIEHLAGHPEISARLPLDLKKE
jgi:LysR family transcriptional regulator for bpeEF and oprC